MSRGVAMTDPASGETSPRTSYGRRADRVSVTSAIMGVILLIVAILAPGADAVRSACLGAGLVGVSAALTMLVSSQMLRLAPAATAPALAALYLVKILVLGWFLLFFRPPGWLVPSALLFAAVLCQVLATVFMALVARDVSTAEARRSRAERASDAAAEPAVPDAPVPAGETSTTSGAAIHGTPDTPNQEDGRS